MPGREGGQQDDGEQDEHGRRHAPVQAERHVEDQQHGPGHHDDQPGQGYTEFSTPYLGLPQVLRPDGLYRSQQRFGMYRWHVLDPIYFATDLRVNIQALGWQSGSRYLPLHDDIASTALFYLDRPTTNRPEAPTFDTMEITDGSAAAPFTSP